MAKLSEAQTAQIAQATSAFGPVPKGYIQPQTGYKMNYAGASDTGFKRTMEHGVHAVFKVIALRSGLCRIKTQDHTGSLLCVLQTKRVFHSPKEIRIMSTFITDGYKLNADGVLIFFRQKRSIQR